MRSAQLVRTTKETDIVLSLTVDGTGNAEIDTGCGFMDHMLTLFASHGRFDLKISCRGDTKVDYHHTTEDLGIVLGTAFKEALGDKKGIARYGYMVLPMDEALILSAVDFSGRAAAAGIVRINNGGALIQSACQQRDHGGKQQPNARV